MVSGPSDHIFPNRLEAATSRLEDIATSTELPKDVAVLSQTETSPVSDSPAPKLPSQAALPNSAPRTNEPMPEAIEEFDQLISSSVDNYVKLSNELGGVVEEQVSTSASTSTQHYFLANKNLLTPQRLPKYLKDFKNSGRSC